MKRIGGERGEGIGGGKYQKQGKKRVMKRCDITNFIYSLLVEMIHWL